MRWSALLIAGVTAVLAAGCNKTVYRAYESQYCSSDDDEDPFRECARSSDLVCINTYKMSYPQSDGRPPVVRDMWLCRLACDPATPTACRPDEVCCPGPIFGRTYGFTHACVQPSYCASLGSVPRDGGARDATSDVMTPAGGSDAAVDRPVDTLPAPPDAPVDTSAADAETPDAASDAPDAPVDVPAAD